MIELVLLTTLWISKINPSDVRIIQEQVPKHLCVQLANHQRQRILSGKTKFWCGARQV